MKEKPCPAKNKDDNVIAEFLNEVGWNYNKKRKRKILKQNHIEKKPVIENVLKKSIVLNEDFEKLHTVPTYDESEKKLKEKRKVFTAFC